MSRRYGTHRRRQASYPLTPLQIYDMTKSELWRDLLCDESRRRGSEVVLTKGSRILTWQEFALEPEFILPQANQE